MLKLEMAPGLALAGSVAASTGRRVARPRPPVRPAADARVSSTNLFAAARFPLNKLRCRRPGPARCWPADQRRGRFRCILQALARPMRRSGRIMGFYDPDRAIGLERDGEPQD